MQNDNQPNPNQQPQNNQDVPTGSPQGQPPQQGMATPPPAPGQPQQPVQPNQNAYSPTPNSPKKKNSKGLTIALILVILLILGGLLYSYLQSQNEAQESAPATEPQEQVQEPLVEEENVDEDVQLDAQRSLAAVGAFQVNNENRLPDLNNAEDLDKLNEELLDTFISPLTSAPYEFVTQEPQQGQLQLETNVLCSGGVSEGEFLVRTALTNGSIYCTDTLN
jgi:uncharacterized protein HemX